MAGKYKINRSNYTVRGRHQLFSGGVIYERDFMTTTNLGPWDSGSIPYGEGNFRMLYRRTENARKRPRSGSWLEHGSTGSSDSTVWTAGCVEKTGVTEEKSIKIKPNYNSMLDFAYYGSCQELVKSTIRWIINDFPGELIAKQTNGFKINGEDYLLVENPFNVDVFDDGDDKGIKNFARNFKRYRIVGIGAVDSCTITKETGCTHGDITATAVISPRTGSSVTIYKIIYGSEPMLFTKSRGGIEIRPDDEALEEFFENLDDFGRLLLNRESYPKYTATIDWPHETEYGVKTYRRAFTWPMDGEWNLDVVSETYGNYIDELLSIAEFYDEGYTDNLWRMLTHDSIKSMDLAFSNPLKDEDKSDYNIGTTRLEGLLWAYGRQFDELKRSIDNIKFTSNITYDGNNNLPDYFLSDTLELSGWEVYNIDRGLEGKSVDVNWGRNPVSGTGKEYSAEDANNLFLRELKLNSKDILRKKGTRDGVKSLLGLFGMIYGEDFEIHEEVAVVKDKIEEKPIGQQFEIERLNALKASFETSTEADGFNTFDGIPFTYVENGSNKYVIPWFDDNLTYDGGMYFQMYGGWEKFGGKYGETLKYLTIVDKKTDLYSLPISKQYKGSVCYCEEDEKYYELKDESNAGNESGWARLTNQGRIDYLEGLSDDFTGNNPHVGYGKYDDGKEYIERIRVPFSYHVSANTKDNPMFNDAAYDCNGEYDNGFKTTKIKMDTGVTDDKKVWFFGEWIDGKTSSERTGGIWRCCPNDDTSSISQQGKTASASISYNTYDFEKHSYSTSATEASANSIINTKGLSFTFYTPSAFLGDFTKYLQEVILPYLRQILPSSTLWRYEIKTKETISMAPEDMADSPIALVVDAVAYGDSDNINDDYIANYVESHNSRSWDTE